MMQTASATSLPHTEPHEIQLPFYKTPELQEVLCRKGSPK